FLIFRGYVYDPPDFDGWRKYINPKINVTSQQLIDFVEVMKERFNTSRDVYDLIYIEKQTKFNGVHDYEIAYNNTVYNDMFERSELSQGYDSLIKCYLEAELYKAYEVPVDTE